MQQVHRHQTLRLAVHGDQPVATQPHGHGQVEDARDLAHGLRDVGVARGVTNVLATLSRWSIETCTIESAMILV